MEDSREFEAKVLGVTDKNGNPITAGCHICVGALGRTKRVAGVTYIPDTGHWVIVLERGRPLVLPQDRKRIEVVL